MSLASPAEALAAPAASLPAAQGWRWPAEWEPHAATWFSWPHNRETWPGRFEPIPGVFAEMVRALHVHELVRINVRDDAMEADARCVLVAHGVDVDRGVRFHHVPTNDSWARDHGAIFVVRDGDLAALDFGFNSWGGKYGPWDLDDAVPRHMAASLGVARFDGRIVLEGGSIDGNGRGAVLTTASCLLNPNRGPGRTRETMEAVLAAYLGARHVLWLGDGIAGDDTDGHIDDVTRFVDAGTVVTAVEDDPADPNHAPLAANLARLRGMRDQDGKPLAVATLPMPPPVLVDGQRCPASYANFLLANGAALVPVFDAPQDARALAVLREVLPGREVIGIPSRELVFGLGAIHCLTQQVPDPSPLA
jgi:agmatine deiminase